MPDGQRQRPGSQLCMTVRRPFGERRCSIWFELASDSERLIDHLPEQGWMLAGDLPIAACSAHSKAQPIETHGYLIDRGDPECGSKALVAQLVMLEGLAQSQIVFDLRLPSAQAIDAEGRQKRAR